MQTPGNFQGFFIAIQLILSITLKKNIAMSSRYSFFLLGAIFVACSQPKSKDLNNSHTEDSIAYLKNENCQLGIDPYGGAFVNFQFNSIHVNPFTWKLSQEQMPVNNQNGAVFQGHFLCLGRWGQPTSGEIKAGIPHNGEPANTWWNLSETSIHQLSMNNIAPLDGLSIQRVVKLHRIHPVFKVTEEVTNELSIGRIYNIVQHPTIGPPFLDTSLVVFSNAGPGFFQVDALPNPEARAYNWPTAINDSLSQPIDLQATSNINYVTTHIFPTHEKYGWVAAYSPTHDLILGYFWSLSDYPWLNIWNHFENKEPVAKGLEFGTTGIGADYEKLLAHDTRFHGHNSFEYIDAGETKQKVYFGFLIHSTAKIKSLNSILLDDGVLKITNEKDQSVAEFDINPLL